MANDTKQDIIDMNEALISPDIDGSPIQSIDHRTFNMAMVDFLLSLLPIDLYVSPDGKIKSALLINRIVSYIIVDNSPIQSNFILKPFASDTLEFTNGVTVEPNKLATIVFKKQEL